MKKSFKEHSNCVQGIAEELGNSSSGFAPAGLPLSSTAGEKSSSYDLYLRKSKMTKAVRKQLVQLRTWKHYESQGCVRETFSQVGDYLSKLKAVRSFEVPSKLMFHIEGLIALYFAAIKSVDVVQAVSIAVLYSQRYFSESISSMVSETLISLSVSDQGPSDKPDWLKLLKSAKDNWKLVLMNEGFKNMSNVISIMLSLGLCDSSQVNFTIAGMKMFSLTAAKKQSCAIDLIDAVFETVTFFVEGGYRCFQEGSISPLLSGDIDMHELEERIATCERNGEFAKTGDLESKAGISATDFDTELREVIEKLSVTHQTANNDYIKRLMYDKLQKLRKIQTVFVQTRVQGGLREAPYAMTFFGTSGVGKSCVANILMITTLMYNGYSASDDRIATINDLEKYMSNWQSNKNGLHVDDVGNTKAEYVELAPSKMVIQFCNNVRQHANMAEAEMKGKVSIEPKVVCFTTNVKTLCAEQYSNEPASITRRSQFTATIKVKPQFARNGMLCQELVASYYTGIDKIPIIPDLWDITVERSFPIPSPTRGHPDLIGFEIEHYNDPEYGPIYMKDVSLDFVIRFANYRSEVYFKQQRQFVENSNNLAQKLAFCPSCRFPGTMCVCREPEVPALIHRPEDDDDSDDEDDESEASTAENEEEECEQQAGQYLAQAVFAAYNRFCRPHVNNFDQYLSYFEETATNLAMDRLELLMTSPYTVWTNYIPTDLLNNAYIQQAILAYNQEELKSVLRSIYVLHSIILFVSLLSGIYISRYVGIPMAFYSLYVLFNAIETEKARIFARVTEDNQSMPDIFRKYRDSYISYICGLSVIIAAGYVIIQAWKFSRWIAVEEQGNITPKSMADIQDRDAEAVLEEEIANNFNWATRVVDPIPCNEVSSTTTCDQLKTLVFRNLGFMYYHNKKGRMNACDIFFIRSNVALIPCHMWQEEELRVRVLMKKGPGKKPTGFNAILSHAMAFDLPEHDLSLVWVPNGGSWADLTQYFPLEKFRSINGHLLYKQFSNDTISEIQSTLVMKPGFVGNNSKNFYGASYSLQFNTFVGLCMGTIISDAKQSIIAGFHLGGVSGKPFGICATVLYPEIMHAIDMLGAKPGVTLTTSAGTLPKQVYGKTTIVDQSIHPKSPVHKLSEDSHVEVYGTCPGRATYFSDVEESMIAKHIENVCTIKNTFGKPKFHLGKAWEESLKVSSTPSIGVEGSLLTRAVEDYTSGLIAEIEKIPELKKYIRPLTRMETLCGIDGLRFIDKIPSKTSIGAPLSGPKSKFITLLNPVLYPDFACPAELDPMFWDHFEQCCKEFRLGRRVYFLFKACLKDEPTPLDKDKVRVFQAAPIVLQLFIRMYFLPIVRLLSLFPLTSECAVGINTVGPEFHALIEFIRKFGADRILAGDYSKYDLRMPAQLILAAFSVLIAIAKHFGYSDDDILIMRAVATEVAYPLIMYNGDLIQHFGSNPSGQNLTVYINSIVNSLLMRCCFFQLYPKAIDFREDTAMVTYGDDVKGSVSEKRDNFNHLTYAQWLKEHDMVFTMPDKKSTPTKYMNDADSDFLKRTSKFNADLNMWQGALDEASIFKSLFCNLKSKVLTKAELAQQNIDGALREWWFHGKEMYETRRVQMQQVADLAKISHGCALLDKDYDWMLSDYCDKYKLPYPERLSRNDLKSVPPSADTCSLN